MDPVTLILAALAAGAARAAEGLVEDSARDAYASLKQMVKKAFAGKKVAQADLEQYEQDPETYTAPLRKHVRETGLDKNPEILEVAERVLDTAEAKGPEGDQINVGIMQARDNAIAAAKINNLHIGNRYGVRGDESDPL